MAGRRLKLVRKAVTQVNYQFLGAYRLRIEVSDPDNTGADPNVFLFLRRPVNPYNQEVLDDFHAIASPVDLAEYPVGEPNALTTYPFYRIDFIELDFRSTAQANDTWTLIVAEVDALLRALDRLDALEVVEETYVGADADTGNSASNSTSTSTSV
jgi:hypothetical protein